ncbi:MAG: phosphatidate cytidylyltransferase [Gammaproteobacteria bacterium]|nr:phosphatidate cytidylyltransferase [Gammaproteobacteria bacterium]
MMVRVATGLALALVAFVLTIWSPSWLFAALALAVLLGALVEWNRLKPNPVVVVAGIASLVTMAAVVLFFQPHKLPVICLAGLLFWAYQAVDLARRGVDDATEALGGLVQGAVVLLIAWCALLWMHIEQGPAMTIAMLAVVWSADSGAYFAGKRFGKRRLAPSISPGKTVAGLIGGLAGAAMVAWLLASLALGLNAAQTRLWLLASLAAALFSVVGDLYESRLKRRAGVKDSSALLPGHGGILDRIDGILAALPPFVIIWRLSE